MSLSKEREKIFRKSANTQVAELREEGVIVEWITDKEIVDEFIKRVKTSIAKRKQLTSEDSLLIFAQTFEDFSTDRQYVYDWLGIKEDPWNVFCENHKIKNLKRRYKIIEKIGEGTYGTVHKAYDKVLKKNIALKILKLKNVTREKIQDLKAELEALKKLSYSKTKCTENISCLYNWYCIDYSYLSRGNKFIVSMELIEGVILFDYFISRERKGGMILVKRTHKTPAEEDKIIKGLARGVKTLQDANVVHMDLHAGNILITKSGTPKIIDFGLACFGDHSCETLRRKKNWKKHEGSRPPEIVGGTIKPTIRAYKAADIWMLGKLIDFSSRGQDDLYGGLVNMMTYKNPTKRPDIYGVIKIIDQLQTYKKELIDLALSNGSSPFNIWVAVYETSYEHKISFKEALQICC